MAVKVFISWSGRRSQGVAEALGKFLKKVIQSVEPFISTAMDAGVKWNEVVAKNLDEHGIGILCVTPGNVERPWLNFEAGALSRHLDDSGRVIPYLLDFGSAGNLNPPLSQFNAVTADKQGTFKLVQTLNGLDSRPQATEDLEETFEAFWPSFAAKLEEIRTSSEQPPARRSDGEKLDELLAISHQLLRREEDRSDWSRFPLTNLSAARHKKAMTLHQVATELAASSVLGPELNRVLGAVVAAASGRNLTELERDVLLERLSHMSIEHRQLLEQTLLGGVTISEAAGILGVSESDAAKISNDALRSLLGIESPAVKKSSTLS